MLKKILIGLVVILAGLAIFVALQPDDFRVTRSATFTAPADAVFAQVNDLQKWQTWSPWARLDPNAKNTFEGPASGVGTQLSWSGNSEVGEGSMKITESRPNELVKFQLDFIKPFAATSTAEFTFKPEGDKTVVNWSMYGKNNFIGKAIGLVMNCEKMVGDQFEQGFANLKSIVEKK